MPFVSGMHHNLRLLHNYYTTITFGGAKYIQVVSVLLPELIECLSLLAD